MVLVQSGESEYIEVGTGRQRGRERKGKRWTFGCSKRTHQVSLMKEEDQIVADDWLKVGVQWERLQRPDS